MMLSDDLNYWRDVNYFNSQEFLEGSRKNLNVTNEESNLLSDDEFVGMPSH